MSTLSSLPISVPPNLTSIPVSFYKFHTYLHPPTLFLLLPTSKFSPALPNAPNIWALLIWVFWEIFPVYSRLLLTPSNQSFHLHIHKPLKRLPPGVFPDPRQSQFWTNYVTSQSSPQFFSMGQVLCQAKFLLIYFQSGPVIRRLGPTPWSFLEDHLLPQSPPLSANSSHATRKSGLKVKNKPSQR
jgi:hypothetical protein